MPPSQNLHHPHTLVAMKSCVGLVELGSSSLRCCIAETDGRTIRLLEELEHHCLAGEDVFRAGKITANSMEDAVQICKRLRQTLDTYQVTRIRAVASSTLGSSANGDILLERIKAQTGIAFELLDEQEEARLLLVALRGALRQRAKIGSTLAIDLSGSSAELLSLEKGLLTQAASFGLGTLRLRVLLEDLPRKRRFEALQEHIHTHLRLAVTHFPTKHFSRVVLAGRDAVQIAQHFGHKPDKWGLCKISREELLQYARERFIEDPGHDTDTGLVAYGALLFAELLEILHLPFGWVPKVATRDGLLEELCDTSDRWLDTQLSRAVLNCVRKIGKRFQVEAAHAHHVAEISMELFDHLIDLHGMDSQDRLLLQVAAELHEIGHFVNPRSHHKHSAYLIEACEIPGISKGEVRVAAQVARYHRRSSPKTGHPEFLSLPPEDRVRVRKLAALLRIADSLDACHEQEVELDGIDRSEGSLFLRCRGKSVMTLETLALKTKSNLFQETYGIAVKIVPQG